MRRQSQILSWGNRLVFFDDYFLFFLFNCYCGFFVFLSLTSSSQVMVFVHSRKDTVKTAMAMVEMAQAENEMKLFAPRDEDPGF